MQRLELNSEAHGIPESLRSSKVAIVSGSFEEENICDSIKLLQIQAKLI